MSAKSVEAHQTRSNEVTSVVLTSRSEVSSDTMPLDVEQETQNSFDERDVVEESMLKFFFQSLIPFLIAGGGLIGSGVFLTTATKWNFVRSNCEVIILLPALLGLKGNLEMSFSSRLSTMANMGFMEKSKKSTWKIIYTNLALLQAQSVLLCLFATAFVFTIQYLVESKFNPRSTVLMAAAAVISASVSSVIMVSIMSVVVYVSRICGINPDNVTSPVAASIGDFVQMSTFLGIGTLLMGHCDQQTCYLNVVLIVIVVVLAPLWIAISFRESSNHDVLIFGWWAPMIAIVVSSGSGFILSAGLQRYPGIEAFSPLIGGLAGNRCAVQSSRISTSLHTSRFPMGVLPLGSLLPYLNPIRAFFSRDLDSRTAQVLASSSVPGQLLFVSVLCVLSGKLSWNGPFIGSYVVASFIQIIILLYFTQLLVRILWRIKIDPDHSSIPLITSIGDIIGNALLFAVFALLQRISPSSVWLNDDNVREAAINRC